MSNSATLPTAEQYVTNIIDGGKVSRVQILVIVLCTLCNMVDGFDITTMSIVAKSVSTDLGLTPDKLGYIFSFALAGMMVGSIALAPISDLIGRRKTMLISMLLVSVSVYLTSFATDLTTFIALRFISGIGAGAVVACVATLASEYSHERYKALAVGLVTAGYPLGAMMTSVVGGEIMPDHGWQGMFVFGGGATLFFAVMIWFFVPESLKFLLDAKPKGALDDANKILSSMGRSKLDELPQLAEEVIENKRGLIANVALLLRPEYRRTTLLLWASLFLSFVALYVLFSWIPKLVEDAGYGAATGRDAFFWFNMGGVIGIVGLGALNAKFKLSQLMLVTLMAAAIAMALFDLSTHNLTLMMLTIFAIGVLQQGGFVGLYSAAAIAYPTRVRSTGLGLGIGLGRLGAVAGPIIAGYLIAGGMGMAGIFYTFAVPLAISAILAWLLRIH